MTDREFMLHAFKGDQNAVNYVLMIARVVDIWDNLIDKDVPVSDEDVNDVFWLLFVEIPRNAFYRAHMDDLIPVTETGVVNWFAANQLEKSGGDREIEIAHVIRYSIADVALMAVLLCGGRQWAEQVGPELRMRSQRSDLKEYINSLRAKHEVIHGENQRDQT